MDVSIEWVDADNTGRRPGKLRARDQLGVRCRLSRRDSIYAIKQRMRVIIDTNVFIGALLSPDRAPRAVIRLCLEGHLEALMGNALFSEYEALMGRHELFERSRLSEQEREELFDAFVASSRWMKIHFLWRPDLRDEADNHLVELGVAGNAEWIITRNLRDLRSGELVFPKLRIATPEDFLLQWS